MHNIAREVLRRGHKLTFYCHSWEGPHLSGAKIEIIPAKGWTNHGKMLSFVRKFQKTVHKCEHDLVVGFKRMPGLDLYYNGDVCYQHEVGLKYIPLLKLAPRYKILSSFEKAVFSKEASTHIMYIAEREKRIFQSCYETPEQRFHPLPAGIDKKSIRDASSSGQRTRTRSALGVSGDSLVLLMIGSDFQRKGVDRSMRALAALPADLRQNTQLWVVGKGDARPFAKMGAELGIADQVVFLGPRDDVPHLLAAADILLHPALSETAGNAILEGLVAGIPVVVSESAGFSVHVARADGGLVVSDIPWHQHLLDKALLRLASDQEFRKQLGQNGWYYADITDLYGRPRVACDIIEKLVKEKVHADLAC
ncbi:glycosyltransferase [Syntrophotalea carbinolica DSM 2380]|uniref:Glycosyltransferase n=2 Tax=Syntrophotalea carbinolica TaxID=19 RepID=Q3A534_SYNC1|nr:glycosyltransferase [Syntrophotalea carbinolica DSM 2380]